jgi:hypothetical protein
MCYTRTRGTYVDEYDTVTTGVIWKGLGLQRKRFEKKTLPVTHKTRQAVYVKRNYIFMFYNNQQMHNYIIQVYITTVSLCNLYCYMFRHFRIVITPVHVRPAEE